MIKQIFLFFSVITLLLACKDKTSTNAKKVEFTDIPQINTKKSVSTALNQLNDDSAKSFTISCGSGCAMTFNAEKIGRINKSIIEVIFNVTMYQDDAETDSYHETYFFHYNSSSQLEKITKLGDEEDILSTQTVDAQKSFKDFAEDLIKDKNNTNEDSCFGKSKITLPYNQKININNVSYKLLTCNSIVGIDKFLCKSKQLRYILFPAKNDISVILVPQDCGDFSYRFYLLTIYKNTVSSGLYVEGEWFEPDDEVNKETTSFSIDNQYNIVVETKSLNLSKSENYIILDDGNIEKHNL